MFTGRFAKVLVLLLMLVAALFTVSFVTRPAKGPSADRSYDSVEQIRVAGPQVSVSAARSAPDDFYQRHPGWTWTSNEVNAVMPVTGESTYLDYAQRHPELSAAIEVSSDTIDYPDYYFRHPELSGR